MNQNLSKLNDMLAKIRASKNVIPASAPIPAQTINIPTIPPPEDYSHITDKYGNQITLNAKQLEFVNIQGSCVLIGAAGTGKTTCQKAKIQKLIQTGEAGILSSDGHKHLKDGSPGIAIVAYTKRAVANIRKNVPADLQDNCITIHKLLEYEPVYSTVMNEETGDERTKMEFKPTRDSTHPLPSSLRYIIIEEASMVGTDLFEQIVSATPHGPKFIFLGDIQQLPPVFGAAILGFKLLELPVVELTEVYRQALESPIIKLAHRILSGSPISGPEYTEWNYPNQLRLHPWKKKISPDDALNTAALFLVGSPEKKISGAIDSGLYNPEEDMILIPFNKSFGTDELNKKIANRLAHDRGTDVYEILAGFDKHYFSPGDKVLYDKLDARIISIESNPGYAGAKTQHHSPTMDYWGYDPEAAKYVGLDENDFDVDLILSSVASGEDRVNQCSHKIKIRFEDTGFEQTLSRASEVNSLSLGFCLTVHKAQGSEWRKVFLFLHQSHATMVQRELLYTAVTRAREDLYVICEPESFTKGIMGQRIKGNTLAEKAEFFKGKLERDNQEKLK